MVNEGFGVSVVAHWDEWEKVRVAARLALGRLRSSAGDWDDVGVAIDELAHIEGLAIEVLEGAP